MSKSFAIVPRLYRSFLREARRMEAEHSVLRLVPPVDIAQWGKGGYVKDSDPSSLQSALFPGVDFQAGGFAEVIELDSAVIRAVAKSQFRRALNSEDSSDPLSNGLRHLATLNRLRASEPSHTLTRTTFGSAVVDVELSTAFARIRSDSELAALGVFPYAYRIRVTNRGSETCQLVGRHWKFEDAAQHVIEVPRSSPGVVGHSPVLEPGQAFEYTSGTQIATPSGTMEGSFQMVIGNSFQSFDAIIARTHLMPPSNLLLKTPADNKDMSSEDLV